jgi:hypothetical protein
MFFIVFIKEMMLIKIFDDISVKQKEKYFMNFFRLCLNIVKVLNDLKY